VLVVCFENPSCRFKSPGGQVTGIPLDVVCWDNRNSHPKGELGCQLSFFAK
jgi:hypothetical protein